jgi:A/G-specific adenine glycosylase
VPKNKKMNAWPSRNAVLTFQYRVVEYYEQHGRKNLPWRLTSNPWKILLAEMLLRKTTARQVLPIYEVLSIIDTDALAVMRRAKLEDILKPIGIYRERAKLIIAAAKKVSEAGTEELVKEEFLTTIKGAGPYAVNTVLCFAEGHQRPALDSNMIRILERVFKIKSVKRRAHTDSELWKVAGEIVPQDKAREYNWGILDLGALVCKSRGPICEECCLNDMCFYYGNMQETNIGIGDNR